MLRRNGDAARDATTFPFSANISIARGIPHRWSMTVTTNPPRMIIPVRGRRPGRAQRDGLLRIWSAVDDDGRKMLLFFARQLAKEQGLVPPGTPLVMTDQML